MQTKLKRPSSMWLLALMGSRSSSFPNASQANNSDEASPEAGYVFGYDHEQGMAWRCRPENPGNKEFALYLQLPPKPFSDDMAMVGVWADRSRVSVNAITVGDYAAKSKHKAKGD
eukprot:15429139-Alexandrium_andersonii.AAC.1